ncbi:hypothetical protein V1477_010111, partial [Vespula maculifrons]
MRFVFTPRSGTIAISTATDTTITTTIGGVRDTIERGDSRESNEKFAAAVMAAVTPLLEPPLLSRLRSFLSSIKESAKKEDGMRGSIIHTSSSALKRYSPSDFQWSIEIERKSYMTRENREEAWKFYGTYGTRTVHESSPEILSGTMIGLLRHFGLWTS